MKYVSTRCTSTSTKTEKKQQQQHRRLYTFREALSSGYAPDGGLFVPEELPKDLLSPSRLGQYLDLEYPALSAAVLRHFISEDEIPRADLDELCRRSFVGFEDAARAVPVVPIGNNNDSKATSTRRRRRGNVYSSELWHGPTFCFKDLGMRIVVNLLSYFCRKYRTKMLILAATTGDTGPAAVRAVVDNNDDDDNNHAPAGAAADDNNEERNGVAATQDGTASAPPPPPPPPQRLLTLLVHYPRGQISEFQRKQMTTAVRRSSSGGNDGSGSVRIVAFEGGGDDMDIPIKNLLASSRQQQQQQLQLQLHFDNDGGGGLYEGDRILTGVNSYNIGRPLMQMVHFVWTYLRVMEDEIRSRNDVGDDDDNNNNKPPLPLLDFVLPTGAMGNMAGGYMAKKMGLPIGKLVAGVNLNDVTHRAFSTGIFYKPPGQGMHRTLSEAINVQLPYNFERLLFYLTDQNHDLVRSWMTIVDSQQKLELSTEWLARLQQDFESARAVTDDEVCEMVRHLIAEYDYWVCPNTAVAWCAAEQLGYYTRPTESPTTSDETETSDENGGKLDKATPVAILSTASPCKFQEALVVAVGQDGWERYKSKHFPKAAQRVLDSEETPPVLYKAKTGATLQQTQEEWERLAREIIDDMANPTSPSKKRKSPAPG